MALKTATATAATAARPAPKPAAKAPADPGIRFATSKTSAMVQTGLANKFWGRGSLHYGIRKYEKGPKAGQFYLAVVLTVQADDPEIGKEGIVEEYMRAGDLDQWVPCDAEGNLPGGLTLEDFAALGRGEAGYDNPAEIVGTHARPGLVGTQDGLPVSTKYGQFLSAVEDLNYDGPDFSIDVSQFDVRAFWERIKFKSRGGQEMTLDEGQRAPEVLVPTELEAATQKPAPAARPAAAKAATPASAGTTNTATTARKATAPTSTAAPKAAPAAAKAVAKPAVKAAPKADSGPPLRDRVATELATLIEEAGGAANRTDLGAAIVERFQPAERAKVINIINDMDDFLGSREEFDFDPEADVLLLPGYTLGGDEEEVAEEE